MIMMMIIMIIINTTKTILFLSRTLERLDFMQNFTIIISRLFIDWCNVEVPRDTFC